MICDFAIFLIEKLHVRNAYDKICRLQKEGDVMYLPGTIGERIGDLRSGKGLNQKELSKIIGITSSQMSRIENDRTPSISSDTLIKLSDYFNVSIDFILRRTDISLPKNYDINELGLSEGAVNVFLSKSIDMQILNRVFEHKWFPNLVEQIKRYADDSYAAGVTAQNEIIDFAASSIYDYVKENPEHKADAIDDIQELKKHKLTTQESILIKIQSLFMAIVKDVKKNFEDKVEITPLATREFMQGVWAQLKDKPRSELTEEDVSIAVTNMVKQQIAFEGKGVTVFQKFMAWLLRNSFKSDP